MNPGPEGAEEKQKRGRQLFQPGQSGNPAGRPKGSRNKLGEQFVAALHDDFIEHGAAVIQAVREKEPAAYLRVIASLLPKQVELDDGGIGKLTDEQVARVVQAIDAWIEANPDEGSGLALLSPVSETEAVSRSRGKPN